MALSRLEAAEGRHLPNARASACLRMIAAPPASTTPGHSLEHSGVQQQPIDLVSCRQVHGGVEVRKIEDIQHKGACLGWGHNVGVGCVWRIAKRRQDWWGGRDRQAPVCWNPSRRPPALRQHQHQLHARLIEARQLQRLTCEICDQLRHQQPRKCKKRVMARNTNKEETRATRLQSIRPAPLPAAPKSRRRPPGPAPSLP